ncbi:MAG: DUF5011 domain-containing protein, partial [Altererythrobacter ishigakiensis]|nr:DUF5011 domain-containing protein [Altererythrobacter ishigakiensis]
MARIALTFACAICAFAANANTYQWYATPISSGGTAISDSTQVNVWFGFSAPSNPSTYQLIIIDSNNDGRISKQEWSSATGGGGLGHNGASTLALFDGNRNRSGTLYTANFISSGTSGLKSGLVSNFSPFNPNNISPPVDTTAPVITLLGNATVTIEVGSSYSDAGATAADNQDGDL